MKYFLAVIILVPIISYGQVEIYNNGADIIIDNGVTITFEGQFTNKNNGTVSNDGNIRISGDWRNDGSNNIFVDTSGTVTFYGYNAQAITGNDPTYFYNLKIDKTGQYVLLNNNYNIVLNELNLSQGYLILGANTLILDTAAVITGAPGADSYVKAYGSGMLRKNLTQPGNFTFPVGGTDYYSPFTLLINAATFSGADYFEVNVTDGTHPGLNHNDYINRYWTVNASGFSAIDYDVSMNYVDYDITGDEQKIFCKLYDGNWTNYNIADEPNNILSSSSGINSVPNFYDFTGAGLAVLPVKLISFTATPSQSKVEIMWTTAGEYNNQYFEVERSLNGVEFTTLEKVAGAGNSSEKITYIIYDKYPYSGRSYYRLKQVDWDGMEAYSPIVSVDINDDEQFITYQSDTRELIFRSQIVGEKQVTIFDMQGKVVYQHQVLLENNDIFHSINLPEFPSSVYIVHVRDIQSQRSISEKIIIK